MTEPSWTMVNQPSTSSNQGQQSAGSGPPHFLGVEERHWAVEEVDLEGALEMEVDLAMAVALAVEVEAVDVPRPRHCARSVAAIIVQRIVRH